MTETVLSKGQNCALPSGAQRLQLVVAWDEPAGPVAVDAGALLLTDTRRVRSDEDFVFFNQPASPEGALRHVARPSGDAGAEERIALDLGAVPDEVVTVAVTASLLEGTFGDMQGLRLLALDDVGDTLVRYDITGATSETAFVFGEVYRRAEEWKVRAVGQGWDSGLAGLATDFGVTVDDSPEPDATLEGEPLEQTAPTTPGQDDVPAVAAEEEPASAAAEESVAEPGLEGAAGEAELVEVVERQQEPALLGQLIALPTVAPKAENAGAPAPTKRRAAGVRTSKTTTAPIAVPRLKLAGAESWDPARLFSISGVGTAEEQEKRATSVLLATMLGVPAFARALTSIFRDSVVDLDPRGSVVAEVDAGMRV